MLTLKSSHRSSSPVVESDQSIVTCFDLIRSHQPRLLVRRQEVRKLSNLVPASFHRLESHINSANSSLVAQLKISEASEKAFSVRENIYIEKMNRLYFYLFQLVFAIILPNCRNLVRLKMRKENLCYF